MSDVAAETPLTELRVVDFTHFIAGPFCTMILGDFGADVIKIESPEGGDAFRQYPPHCDGEGAPHLWVNRNKASVILDLKTTAGRDVALALTEKADVMVENFSTGVMQRLGLDYETVKARNSRVGLLFDFRLWPQGIPCRSCRLRSDRAGRERLHLDERVPGRRRHARRPFDHGHGDGDDGL